MRDALPQVEEGIPLYELLLHGAPAQVIPTQTAAGTVADPSRIANAVAAAATRTSRRRLRRLAKSVAGVSDDEVLSLALDEVRSRNIDTTSLRLLGTWLCTASVRRASVRTGLGLLAQAGVGESAAIVRTLGKDETLTTSAVATLTQGLGGGDLEVWKLAKTVRGAGRIRCIEALAGTKDAEVRRWILCEGLSGTDLPLDAETAALLATTGSLANELDTTAVDRVLLTAAGSIFTALAAGAAGEEPVVRDEVDAIQPYLAHMRTRASNLDDLAALQAVASILRRTPSPMEESARHRLAATCDEILAKPRWSAVIESALDTADDEAFARADGIAKVHGVDTFGFHLARIEGNPHGTSWDRAFEQTDTLGARRLAALASRALTTRDEGTGPGAVRDLLASLLAGLDRFSGIGGEVVLAGLGHETPSIRAAAIDVLGAWSRSDWPDGALAAVEHIAHDDPAPDTRAAAYALLTGS
ncbi:MAG: hypothetical protein ACE5GC_09315 [Acidimicrobiia bacterium]